MKKNERKKIITHPTIESLPLLIKWYISFQSFFLQGFWFIVLFDTVSIILINSTYLKTKTLSIRCYMVQCELLYKGKLLLPWGVVSLIGNQK